MSRLYARITQRNIDICSTERQSRYGFLNFFVQSIKENQKVLGLFEYEPLGFGIHFPMKLSVALV